MTFLFKDLPILGSLHRSAAEASQDGLCSSTFFFVGVGT